MYFIEFYVFIFISFYLFDDFFFYHSDTWSFTADFSPLVVQETSFYLQKSEFWWCFLMGVFSIYFVWHLDSLRTKWERNQCHKMSIIERGMWERPSSAWRHSNHSAPSQDSGVFIVWHLFQFVFLCIPFSVLLHVLFENNLKSYRTKEDA